MYRNKFLRVNATFFVVSALTLTACGSGIEDLGSYPEKASEWVSSITKAEWDEAKANLFTVTMVENSDGTYGFTAEKPLVFEATRPYVLKIVNPTTNAGKHYFTAPDFFKSIATRKLETADAEYKFPYLQELELLQNASSAREALLYFVAVKTGSYAADCTIGTHSAQGMHLPIEITGLKNLKLDFEIPADFNSALTTDARKSGSHAVWSSMATQTVTMTESGDAASFSPLNPTFTKDQAYKLTLTKAAEISEHYYTASSFFRTVVWRKLQDSHVEVKPYYLNAIELRDGAHSADLYFVPTQSGSYGVECTITGHKSAGMDGIISVP
ncbi:MAG: hypothetical protein NDJ89_04800 [Oligoflexia bacterium]|nr:hypothetical protein [Oligoflexia bacterium]